MMGDPERRRTPLEPKELAANRGEPRFAAELTHVNSAIDRLLAN